MIRTVCLRTTLLPLLGAFLSAPLAANAQDEARLHQAEQYASGAAERGFSGTVLVSHGEEVVLHHSYGLADRELGVPVTTGTLFDIGSITKDFTRSAILALSERGELSLADTLSDLFADVPADKAGITVEQLLRHSAGLDEYHDTRGDFEPMTRAQAIDRILAQQLKFEPGSDTAYSNSGYTLLAAIIEEVSGQSYPDFLRDNLWEPAGMTRAGFYHDPRWRADEVALGYDGRPGPGNSRSPRAWPQIGWAMMGNGGMVTSAAELFAWLEASNRGEIVAPATLDAFQGPKQGSGLVRNSFFIAGGNDFGFIAAVVANAERDTMVVVTGNTGGRFNAERVAGQIDRILAGEAPTPLDELGGGRPGGQPAAAGNWGLPESPRGRALSALLDMAAAGTEAAVREFVADWFTDEFRDAFPMEQHIRVLRQLQSLIPDPEVTEAMRTGEHTARMTVMSPGTGETIAVEIEIEATEPYRIASMQLGG